MPRPRELPTDDCLLSAAEAGAICKVSRSRWDSYSKRFPLLIRGRRLVQATPGGRGTIRYLKSAVIAHLHLELACERESTPETDDAVDRTEQEVS
jgi:hypothetical protein